MEARAGAACPVCHSEARSRSENAAFPFCSARCKLVDLGRWLDGSYRVPGPFDADQELDAGDAERPDSGIHEED